MPLFEDDTLEGAIKNATLGLRKPKYGSFGKDSGLAKRSLSAPKSRIARSTETFDDRKYGSRIGSGRGGFRSAFAAARAAASQMGHEAGRTYPDRVAAIKAGQRHRRVMIPELAALISVSDRREIGSGRETYYYDGLYVGRRYPDGSGDFELSASANLAGLVHAHWQDNTPSSADRSNRQSIVNNVSRLRRVARNSVNIEFYVYSLFRGITSY